MGWAFTSDLNQFPKVNVPQDSIPHVLFVATNVVANKEVIYRRVLKAPLTTSWVPKRHFSFDHIAAVPKPNLSYVFLRLEWHLFEGCLLLDCQTHTRRVG